MDIIVRCCGERTEKKCIELVGCEGMVHVIKACPFGESLRQSYKLGMTFEQKWIPMVDGDVILLPGQIKKAIKYLDTIRKNVFCLDGKTKDKIFMCTRRAGIHIYKKSLLSIAYQYINDNKLKPESHVRRQMAQIGYPTVTPKIIFGYHDYEQYYIDLWRKAYTQTEKLAHKIKTTKIIKKWIDKSKTDLDYKVILLAHQYANRTKQKIVIDKRINFDAEENFKKIGIIEKDEL